MAGQFSNYTVKQGDSLTSIAQKLYGKQSLWPKIAEANKIKAPYIIVVGMRIRIPLQPVSLKPGLPNALSLAVPPGGSSTAAMVLFPALTYQIEEEVQIAFPNGTLKLKVSGELTIEKPGTFGLTITREGLSSWRLAHASGGISTWADGKKFSLDDPMSTGIKAEYGGKLASIFTNCSLRYNPAIGRAELTTGLGWKFGDASYEFKFPACHCFKFPPKKVESQGVSGTLSFVAEITEGNARAAPNAISELKPVSLPITQQIPTLSRQQQSQVAGALTLSAALLLMIEYAPLLLLAL